jgi:hypothetical protein
MTDTVLSVDRVEANAHRAWLDAAYEVVERLAKTRRYFTTDDVHELLDGQDVWTHEARAMGAVLRKAARNGLIVGTNEYALSQRAVAHSNPKRVWKSLAP